MWYVIGGVVLLDALMVWCACVVAGRADEAAPPMPEWTARDQFESECG